MRIAVPGGSGRLGRAVIDLLSAKGHVLRNLDRVAPPTEQTSIDEEHPTYCEDEYSLSKWVMEQQAFAFARRYPHMTIASLRLHALILGKPDISDALDAPTSPVARDLWGYTLLTEAARACECALYAQYKGHEVFYIIAPRTRSSVPSLTLAQHAFPDVPIRSSLEGHAGFYNTSKARRLLNWEHITD